MKERGTASYMESELLYFMVSVFKDICQKTHKINIFFVIHSFENAFKANFNPNLTYTAHEPIYSIRSSDYSVVL